MKQPRRLSVIRLVLLSLALAWSSAAIAKDFWVYFGTYTGKSSKGIYASRLDASTGKLAPPELVAETTSPTFLAVSPNGKFLYAANEISRFEGKTAGAVSAFALDRLGGKLTALNQKSSGGSGPCHLVVDATGRSVLVANYGGGSVQALPVNQDGSLGDGGTFIQHTGGSVDKGRQAGPHGHCIVADPSNRFALACDLGLDKVLIYKLNPAGAELTANDPAAASVAPGSGPRHIAFRPDGSFAYVISEMACTVTAFAFDARRGALTEIGTVSSLPPGETVQKGFSTAEIEVHPSGKFVYGSNRGHNTIVVYQRDGETGELKFLQHAPCGGKVPRHFKIDPTGKWLLCAHQDSNTISVLPLDPASGMLGEPGSSVPSPTSICLLFGR